MGIPKNASFIPVVVNQNEIAVYNYCGIVRVDECYHDEVGEVVEECNGAHLYMTPDEARSLAEALLKVTTEAAPSTKDALIDRALTEALDALEDVQLIDNTVNEAFDAQSEIETILQVFAATARRIAHQEARDAE